MAATQKTKNNLAQYGGICNDQPRPVRLSRCRAATVAVAGDPWRRRHRNQSGMAPTHPLRGRERPVFHAEKFFSTRASHRTRAIRGTRRITTRSTGWSLCTLSTRQNRFQHLCSRAGSRLTITMMQPTRIPRLYSSPISGIRMPRSLLLELPEFPASSKYSGDAQPSHPFAGPAGQRRSSCSFHEDRPSDCLAVLQADRGPGHSR